MSADGAYNRLTRRQRLQQQQQQQHRQRQRQQQKASAASFDSQASESNGHETSDGNTALVSLAMRGDYIPEKKQPLKYP